MSNVPSTRGFSLIQALLIVSIVSVTSSIAFPALSASVHKQNGTQDDSAQNERQIGLAGIMYGADYDDTMAVLVNGEYRDLQDVADGVLTHNGTQRTDAWPMLLLPYIKSRRLFVDPTRVDGLDIWSGPARAASEEGYDSGKNSYRNQNRFPMYAVNYMFCSPGIIPMKHMGASNAMDYMMGEAHTFTEADDPSGTVYYVPSKYYGATAEGFFVANAPGLWQVFANNVPYVAFWGHSPCSGDWCYDLDKTKDGAQSETNSVYFDRDHKAPITFLDGHVHVMSDVEVADGTDYQTAAPNDGARPNTMGGGSKITDKTHYLWNLTNNYYGA